jgi:hypothetical protein
MWALRYATRTPIGWLYFAPMAGPPDPEKFGRPTDWTNDATVALRFPSQGHADMLRMWMAAADVDHFSNVESIEVK